MFRFLPQIRQDIRTFVASFHAKFLGSSVVVVCRQAPEERELIHCRTWHACAMWHGDVHNLGGIVIRTTEKVFRGAYSFAGPPSLPII